MADEEQKRVTTPLGTFSKEEVERLDRRIEGAKEKLEGLVAGVASIEFSDLQQLDLTELQEAAADLGERLQNNLQDALLGKKLERDEKGTALFGFLDKFQDDATHVEASLARVHERFRELRAEAEKTDDVVQFLAANFQAAIGEEMVQAGRNLADAFAQLGATGRLSMKTLGEAVKKAVGAQIQQIGALAFVRSLFELAAGFASLFLNPAEAGAHFQAAALFAIIGAAASVAGGAIAGSAGGAGAVGGLAGSAGEGLAAEEIPQRRGEVATVLALRAAPRRIAKKNLRLCRAA